MKHTPIENLAHAISCNSGGVTPEGHAHLLEAAKAVVAAGDEQAKKIKILVDAMKLIVASYNSHILTEEVLRWVKRALKDAGVE